MRDRHFEEISHRARKFLKDREGSLEIPDSVEALQKFMEELETYRIELDMQHDELQRTQGELEDAKVKYSSLFEFAPIGYLILDTDMRVIEANQMAVLLLGMGKATLEGKPFHRFVLPQSQDAFHFHRINLLESGMENSCELYLRSGSGAEICVIMDSVGFSGGGGEITSIRSALIDITQRKEAEQQLRTTLEEKELLLKEVHHRVNNNLNTITSLLGLETESIEDSICLEHLEETHNRIRAIALVHNQLYNSRDFVNLNAREYISTLAEKLFNFYMGDSDRIQLKLELAEVAICFDVLIPLGLILNELISNALRHAFKQSDRGEVYISLLQSDLVYVMQVKDTGRGFPDDVDFDSASSLGFLLTKTLCDQLGAMCSVNVKDGVDVRISIPSDTFEEGGSTWITS